MIRSPRLKTIDANKGAPLDTKTSHEKLGEVFKSQDKIFTELELDLQRYVAEDFLSSVVNLGVSNRLRDPPLVITLKELLVQNHGALQASLRNSSNSALRCLFSSEVLAELAAAKNNSASTHEAHKKFLSRFEAYVASEEFTKRLEDAVEKDFRGLFK